MKKLIFGLFLTLIATTSIKAQQGWEYKEYAQVENDNGILFLLEYGIKSAGYDGNIKWKITSYIPKPIFDVHIIEKEYTLANGKKVERLREHITNKLEPNQSAFSISDGVNTEENYGNYSDKNNNPVINISVKAPIIEFATEKDGEKKGWDIAGKVKLK